MDLAMVRSWLGAIEKEMAGVKEANSRLAMEYAELQERVRNLEAIHGLEITRKADDERHNP